MADIKILRTIGGARIVHMPTCPKIQDWDIEGLEVIDKFNPKKMKTCPMCAAMVFITESASDIVKNYKSYEKLVHDYEITNATLHKLLVENKCKLELRDSGNKLYVKKKGDTFYIDFSTGEVRLFHNNYCQTARQRQDGHAMKGFHEHNLMLDTPSAKVNEALRQIANYDFSEAVKVHKKKKQRMKLSEYDAEYWGFTS